MHTIRLMTAGLAVAGHHCRPGGRPDPRGQARQRRQSTGTGQIFMVNPVQSSRRPEPDRHEGRGRPRCSPRSTPPCQLRNLDGSGYLRGQVGQRRVRDRALRRTAATNTFFYTRDEDQFEQVMALLLGQPGAGVPAVARLRLDAARHRPRAVHTSRSTSTAATTRYQTDKPYRIRLGKGGVDDAEDAEVIVHEYGHAVHAVAGARLRHQRRRRRRSASRSVTTSRVTVGPRRGQAVRLAGAAPSEACAMDWDATSYTHAPALHPPLRQRPDRGGPRTARCTTTARSGARRSGRSGRRLRRARQDHGGLGHHADRLAVRLRRRHVVLGGREGDVRRRRSRATGCRRRDAVKARVRRRGITF